MNVNVSPPRKGFFVIPDEKIRCLSFQNVDFGLNSCFSSASKGLRNDNTDCLNRLANECDISFVDHGKTQQNGKETKTKKKRTVLISRNVEGNRNNRSDRLANGTRVRFRMDENGDILTDYITSHVPDDIKCEDIQTSWWSKKELTEMKTRAKQYCRPFLYKRPDYRSAVIRMLLRCGTPRTGEIPKIDGYLEHSESEEDEDLSTIVDGMHRGLEKRMISIMNLPFHFHKRSICVVLDIQSRLRAIDPSCFTADQKSKMIATQYAVNARYAKEWARKIAEGDSSSVARNFQHSW